MSTEQAVVDASEYATLQDAIDDAPVPAGDDWVFIDAQDPGAVYTGRIELNEYHPPVHILGATDGSGNPDTTIDGDNSGPIIDQKASRLRLEDIKLENGAAQHRVRNESVVEYWNVESGTNFSSRPLNITNGGLVRLFNSTITGPSTDVTAIGTNNGTLNLRDNNIISGGSDFVVSCDAGSRTFVKDTTTIDANSTTDYCIRSQTQANAKVGGELANPTAAGVLVDIEGHANIISTTTFTNCPKNVERQYGGSLWDAPNNEFRVSRAGPYVNETANRSFSTTYTNDTNRDLEVTVFAEISSDGTLVQLLSKVNGNKQDEILDTYQNGDRVTVKVTVPDGATYEITAGGDTGSYTLDKWSEMTR